MIAFLAPPDPVIPYRNLSGDSGVVAYKLGRNHIDIRFKQGTTYRYTERSAGKANVERMKRLAIEGRGLSRFVSQFVWNDYESQW